MDIKDFKTWDEAERWLARHGFGVEQIRLEKVKWDEANKPATISEEPVAKVAKTTTAKVVAPSASK